MRITLEDDERRPIYLQVAEGIRAAIARGELAEGAPLPSVRQVAADLGVNLNTIASAYRELQDEGLITIRHGSGAVVAARGRSRVSEKELRRSLAAVLTQMVLSGMRRLEIQQAVSDELRQLGRGAR